MYYLGPTLKYYGKAWAATILMLKSWDFTFGECPRSSYLRKLPSIDFSVILTLRDMRANYTSVCCFELPTTIKGHSDYVKDQIPVIWLFSGKCVAVRNGLFFWKRSLILCWKCLFLAAEPSAQPKTLLKQYQRSFPCQVNYDFTDVCENSCLYHKSWCKNGTVTVFLVRVRTPFLGARTRARALFLGSTGRARASERARIPESAPPLVAVLVVIPQLSPCPPVLVFHQDRNIYVRFPPRAGPGKRTRLWVFR